MHITYYYKNNVINSTISISATNDNGKYVNSRTANLIDSIQTNTKYFSSKIIPIIDKSIDIDFVNFFIRKAKTVVLDCSIALCYLDYIVHVPDLAITIATVLTNIMQFATIIGYVVHYRQEKNSKLVVKES